MSMTASSPGVKREHWIQELVIHGNMGRLKIYLTAGLDSEDRPIEIWLDCAKEGATLRHLMHGWAALFSVALQSGVSFARLVKLYKGWQFEPSGRVEGHPKVESCQSILDLVVSVLEAEFNVQPRV